MPTTKLELRKKIAKTLIRANVTRDLNLNNEKHKFMLSCVEYAIWYKLERLSIKDKRKKILLKVKTKLKHGNTVGYQTKYHREYNKIRKARKNNQNGSKKQSNAS